MLAFTPPPRKYVRLDYLTFIVLCVCSILSISIHFSQFRIENIEPHGISGFILLLNSQMNSVNISQIISSIALIFFLKHSLLDNNNTLDIYALICGLIISIFIVLGEGLTYHHNLSFIFSCKKQFLIASIVLVGYWTILYILIQMVYGYFFSLKTNDTALLSNRESYLLYKHFELFCFIGLIVLWSIQMLPYFPGSVPHDGRYQLNQFFGYHGFSTHHPYYSTIVIGTLYKLGTTIFGQNRGTILVSIVQMVMASAVFSKICGFVLEKTTHMTKSFATFLFYAFTPSWWTYLSATHKDALYFVFFSLFAYELVSIYYADNSSKTKLTKFSILILSGTMTCLFRNDAKFVIIPSIIASIIVVKKHRLYMVVSSVLLLCCFMMLNAYPQSYLKLKADNPVEAFSIPIQQMAYCITLYEDEFGKCEIEIINKLVKYEGISERYNPEYSDPVKNHYASPSKEDFKQFFKLWFNKLKTHPNVFITATLNNCYGYLDPMNIQHVLLLYPLYNKDKLSDYDKNIVYSEYYFNSSLRESYSKFIDFFEKTPLLHFLLNPGFYTCTIIILISILTKAKKVKEVLLFFPIILTTFVCIASPVNGLLRYSLPIMSSIPLYLTLVINTIKSESR